MTKLSKDFLWGGALAANQFEGGYDQGGKGLSVIDVMAVVNTVKLERLHKMSILMNIIRIILELIFITVIKKTLHYSMKWDLNV